MRGHKVLIGDAKDQQDAENFLASKVLQPYFEEANNAEQCLVQMKIKLPGLSPGLADLALRRWRQIKLLLRESVYHGLNDPVRRDVLKIFDRIESSV